MIEHVSEILNFMIEAFLHVWPYLLITIPLAVAVQMSGASKYINRAFQAKPLAAILLATVVGAFSPFCSCGVIPVVASLLIGGVPLAPVMAFWIASPSMDPETFFLSVATIGWKLAVWRLIATLLLSLSAGYVTYFIMQKGWLGPSILRSYDAPVVAGSRELLKQGAQKVNRHLRPVYTFAFASVPAGQPVKVGPFSFAENSMVTELQPAVAAGVAGTSSCCSATLEPVSASACDLECGDNGKKISAPTD